MAFLALGVTLPLLMLQDSWRFAFFALGRGSQAFLNDTVWAVSLVVALVYLRYAGLSNVFWYVFAWGAAAGIGAAVGLLQTRVIPKVSGAREWLSRQRDLGFRYLVEGTSYSAAGLVRNYGIGLILGLTALGYIQAANTLMGPFQVILYGMALAALPEAIRILQRSQRHMMLFCVLCSVGLTLVALAWGITLLVALPRGLGQWLLGPIWRPTYELVLPMTFFMMGGCVSAGAATYMRALGAARRSVRAAIFTSISFLVGSLVGAIEGGAVGAVLGAAAAAFLGSIVYWWQLRATLRETHGIPIPERPLSNDPESSLRPSAGSSGAGIDVRSPARRPSARRFAAVRRRLVTNARHLVVVSADRSFVGPATTERIAQAFDVVPLHRGPRAARAADLRTPGHNGSPHPLMPGSVHQSCTSCRNVVRVGDGFCRTISGETAQVTAMNDRFCPRDSPAIGGQTSRIRCICRHPPTSV